MKRTLAIGATIVGVAAIVWYVQSQPSEMAVPARRAIAMASVSRDQGEPQPEPGNAPAAQPFEQVSVAVTPPQSRAPVDERLLMTTLRELGDSAPQYSLQMARDGNQRFPDSPDAAERGWYVCKSLVNLENFSEARDEARLMVAKYPGTPWATDVERHLLVNPLDLPGDPAP